MKRYLSFRCGPRQRVCGVLAVLVVLLLAACSGRNKATPAPTFTPLPMPTRAPATQAPTTVPTPTVARPPAELPTSAADFYRLVKQARDAQRATMPDFASGLMAFPTNKGYDPRLGDDYARNVYERPFTAHTQDTYYPDLDITLVSLVQYKDWYIVGLRLYGLRPDAKTPQGDYALELDANRDGRGEWLVRVKGPVTATSWQEAGVEVRRDANGDVEGKQVCGSEAPYKGDGYETVVYDGARQARGLAWAMWTAEQQGTRTVPLVLLAVHRSLLNLGNGGFLWQAWADAGVRDPQRMVLHDAYTLEQAGEPYTRSPYFPIKAIAEIDSTCRAAFGFEPTGEEPCLCSGSDILPQAATAQCEADQPTSLPYETCVESRTYPGIWVCLTTDPDSPEARTVECTWNAQACTWQCGNECTGDIALEKSGCTLDESAGLVLCPQPDGTTKEYPEVLCVTLVPGCDLVCEDPDLACEMPDRCVQVGDNLWKCDDGAWETCEYVNDCLWECENQIATCQAPDLCQVQDDGTWACDNGMAFQTCTFDGCWWTCESYGQPPQGDTCQPDDLCQLEPDLQLWSCGDEFLWEVCEYDGCLWDCYNTTVCDPEDACTLGPDGLWYCDFDPDYGYDTCDYDGCYWYCSGTSDTCEDPTACWFDDAVGYWVCDDGSEWATCDYDGCSWYCSSTPDVCEDPNTCWFDDALGYWVCNDGSEWDTCDYDGCYWYCSGTPAVCEDPNTCWFDDALGYWVCNDGSEWDTCDYDGCYWYCSGTPAVCEDPDACWYDDMTDTWSCTDGSVWDTCTYDGCYWSCQ